VSRHFGACSGRPFYFWCVAGILLCTLSGCGTLPEQVERHPSQAILDTAQTHLGVAVAPELAMHPGMSGFHPMGSGPDAFVARVALVRAAEQTLDVQYYDFHIDKIGAALLNELLAAADRGVRVRMLLDDLNNSGRDDILAAVDSHPNVEVRLFNPFVHRHARWLDYLGDFSRVNRRMHNKSITADSQISVVGGRNIGDEYFAASTELTFSDFDLIAMGPVVAEVSAEFDEYWNSGVVYSLSALKVGGTSAAAKLPEVRLKLAAYEQTLRTSPYAAVLQTTDLAQALKQRNLSMYWGESTLIADQPSKVTLPPEDSSTHAIPKLRKVLDQSTQELILVSPYFVPGKSGERWLQDQVHRGVAVKILTNSFAATDVRTVASAYSWYRKDLLRAGIELYELKPSLNYASPKNAHLPKSGKTAKSSLHAKVYESDGHRVFVGSMNLDPRSAALNTEMGLVIDSEPLGALMHDRFLSQLPDVAYHVELETSVDPKGRLVWITHEDGREARYDSEPEMGSWDKFLRVIQRALPIEKQL
jgi:cardiolipin synthase C